MQNTLGILGDRHGGCLLYLWHESEEQGHDDPSPSAAPWICKIGRHGQHHRGATPDDAVEGAVGAHANECDSDGGGR